MSHFCFDDYYTILSSFFFVSRYDIYDMVIIKVFCDLIYKMYLNIALFDKVKMSYLFLTFKGFTGKRMNY